MRDDFVIEVRDLTKKFGEFTANDKINLKIKRGEIHAIIGENGAGKTTFMNMLYGIHQPTSGSILYNGKECQLRSPKDAIAQGVGMVHQHFKLSPSLTIYENVLLGEEITRKIKIGNREISIPIIDQKQEKAAVQELADRFNFNLDVTQKVADTAIGVRQRVEILKMLYRDVDTLILDEPTAVLIPQEIDELIAKLRELREMGKTIVIITHKLEEVKACADRITVLRAGKAVGTVDNDDNATTQMLAEMMVGRPVLLRVEKSDKPVGKDVRFSVRNLSAVDSEGKKVINNVSFDIHDNEVVGIAGVDGNGQSELMYLLTGLMKPTGGEVCLDGDQVLGLWPDALRDKGIGIVPEDRYRQGVCFSVNVSDNLIAGYHTHEPFVKGGLMNKKAIGEYMDTQVKDYDIRLSARDPAVGSLSGGNCQKVIVAREFSHKPKVLLASQPTRGIDVGATEFVHQSILKLRDQGTAVMLISSELSEVVGLSDRVLVMHEGEITGEFISSEVSFNELGLYMSGAKKMERGQSNG